VTAWIGATAYFAVALHWIVEPFLVDAARDGWMAPFALVLMAAGLALFWAMPAWLAARLVPLARPGWRITALCASLILSEAARGTVLTGFPWAYPGHILIDTPMLGAARIAGGQGLNLLVLGYGAAFAVLFLRRPSLAGGLAVLPLAALVIGGAGAPPPETAPDAPVIRLIQPNAPQHLKWRRDMIPVFFQRGLDLTAAPPEDAGRAPDLIIWPETSLPQILDRSDVARSEIARAAGAARVIVGAQRYEGVRPVNTMALLDAEGRIEGVHDKHHLVPFGEYMPYGETLARLGLSGLAEILPGGYAPGPGPALLDLGGDLGTAFPMICYEAIFPGYIRQVDARPDWMLHITNDAWFGTFSGPYQHLALARLRAAEQGVPLLRAANTGISAVIDARGHVVESLPLGEAGYLDAGLPPALSPTLYARTGDAPVLILVAIAALATIAAGRRRTRH
jgi:apolipoprotein N-acyltransferase